MGESKNSVCDCKGVKQLSDEELQQDIDNEHNPYCEEAEPDECNEDVKECNEDVKECQTCPNPFLDDTPGCQICPNRKRKYNNCMVCPQYQPTCCCKQPPADTVINEDEMATNRTGETPLSQPGEPGSAPTSCGCTACCTGCCPCPCPCDPKETTGETTTGEPPNETTGESITANSSCGWIQPQGSGTWIKDPSCATQTDATGRNNELADIISQGLETEKIPEEEGLDDPPLWLTPPSKSAQPPPPPSAFPPSVKRVYVTESEPNKICYSVVPPPLPLDTLFTDIGLPPDPIGEIPFEQQPECLNPRGPAPPPEFEVNDQYEEEADSWFITRELPLVDPSAQATPSYSIYPTSGPDMMNQQTVRSQAVSSVHAQDPDSTWVNFPPWDGIPLDTTNKTKEEICAFLHPLGGTYGLKGLREKFYDVNPFEDNTAPTIAEIDNWNIEIIKHFRALLGINTPVRKSNKLYLEARWAHERQFTTAWDEKYPEGVLGSTTGPCWDPPGSTNPIDIAGGHCGEAFFPSAIDRAPYMMNYPELENNYTARYSRASGLSGANSDLPWCMKLANIISNYICTEGLEGHSGPYVNPATSREEFGCSWWMSSPTDTRVAYRGKWH